MESTRESGSRSGASLKSGESEVEDKEPTGETLKVTGGRYTYSDSRPATPRILPTLPSNENAIFLRNLALANQANELATVTKSENVPTGTVDHRSIAEDRDMDTFVQGTRELSLTGERSNFESTEDVLVRGTNEINSLSVLSSSSKQVMTYMRL